MNILRAKDLSRQLRVSLATLHRWRRAKAFPEPIKMGPNSVGWPEAVVEDWLAKQAQKPKVVP